MKFLYLAFAIFYSSLCWAQDNLKVVYQALTRPTMELEIPLASKRILQIEGSQSLFYQPADLHQPFVKMSAIKQEHPNMIKKNYPDEGKLTFKDCISSSYFYYVEAIPTFEWEMQDGDSLVCNYPCKKAKTTFRGRTWIVWYSEDLPYGDGPWKLCGLPGLILKATDTKGDYSFTAFKISCDVPDKDVKFSTAGYKKTNPQQFAKDKTEYMKDSFEWDGIRKGSIMMDGKPYVPPSYTANLIEMFKDN